MQKMLPCKLCECTSLFIKVFCHVTTAKAAQQNSMQIGKNELVDVNARFLPKHLFNQGVHYRRINFETFTQTLLVNFQTICFRGLCWTSHIVIIIISG